MAAAMMRTIVVVSCAAGQRTSVLPFSHVQVILRMIHGVHVGIIFKPRSKHHQTFQNNTWEGL